MKMRLPPAITPAISCLPNFTRSFKISLITPIYGGGVIAGQPDKEMPVRVSGIRGQLRFWWRLLNRRNFPDTRDLYKNESLIFGGMANGANLSASKVLMWLTDLTISNPEPCATYEKRADGKLKGPNWTRDIPGYALFPGQGQINQNGTGFKNGKQPAEIIFPPVNFELHFEIRGNVESAENIWKDHIKPALRWWACFGGIGARTRRGLGSLKIESIEPVSSEEAHENGFELVLRNSLNNAQAAWKQAIEKLRAFRQGANVGRNPGIPPVPVGRSRWPEADSIREITGCYLQRPEKTHAPVHPARQSFPRAAFGLPIITHFKYGPKLSYTNTEQAQSEPDDTALYPVLAGNRKDRMASPLIIKAMWTGKDYAPISLLLPHEYLERMSLRIENNPGAQNPGLPINFEAGIWWSDEKANAMITGAVHNPLEGLTGNVLADFLVFFGRQP